MSAFSPTNVLTSYANSIDHNTRIEAAITNLELQDRRNIAVTTKKWGVARETLSNRFQGETGLN